MLQFDGLEVNETERWIFGSSTSSLVILAREIELLLKLNARIQNRAIKAQLHAKCRNAVVHTLLTPKKRYFISRLQNY